MRVTFNISCNKSYQEGSPWAKVPCRRSSRALAVDINPPAAARHIPCTKRRPEAMLLKPICWEKLRWNPTITCFISISLVLWMVFSGVNIRMNIEEIIEGYQYVGSRSQWNRVDPSRINENCSRWCCHASHLPPKQIPKISSSLRFVPHTLLTVASQVSLSKLGTIWTQLWH